MRNLQTGDVFNLARLVKKLNVKQDLREIAVKVGAKNDDFNEESGVSQEENNLSLGFDLIFGIVEKFIDINAEEELYKFLSGPFEVTAKEVKEMDPFELVDGVIKIASIEKWICFLKQAIR